jgi:hypothetical protein
VFKHQLQGMNREMSVPGFEMTKMIATLVLVSTISSAYILSFCSFLSPSRARFLCLHWFSSFSFVFWVFSVFALSSVLLVLRFAV